MAKQKDISSIQAAYMSILRYERFVYKMKLMCKEEYVTQKNNTSLITDNIGEYSKEWLCHVTRMTDDRLLRSGKHSFVSQNGQHFLKDQAKDSLHLLTRICDII